MTIVVTTDTIEAAAREVLRWPERRQWNLRDKDRRFRACFGASSAIVATLWKKIAQLQQIQSGRQLNHLH